MSVNAASLVWALLVFAGFILSVCLHEFGHAIVAYWGGDRSVQQKGYLTLNPLKYTHPTYSIVMPLIFLLLGGLPLPGAAVYINTRALRSRGWRSAVAVAG
ncbi:MAG: site-2 protease family protein, partial [Cyanobacteria bacterium P01_F01_bin.42]